MQEPSQLRNAECGLRIAESGRDELGMQELRNGFLIIADSRFPDFLIDPLRFSARGNAEWMNGRVQWLGDRDICFICDADERGSGIRGKCSLMFAYVRLCSLIWKKIWRRCAATGEWGGRRLGRQTVPPADPCAGLKKGRSFGQIAPSLMVLERVRQIRNAKP